jgi:hypothetical protein
MWPRSPHSYRKSSAIVYSCWKEPVGRIRSVNKTRFDFPRTCSSSNSFNVAFCSPMRGELLFTLITVWKHERCLNSEKLWIIATENIITVTKVLKLQDNYEKNSKHEKRRTKLQRRSCATQRFNQFSHYLTSLFQLHTIHCVFSLLLHYY